MNNWNHWIRQIHRWMSIAFTLAVIGAFVALAQKEPIVWVSYLPLAPLALLFFTGLYLFVLPYVKQMARGAGRRMSATISFANTFACRLPSLCAVHEIPSNVPRRRGDELRRAVGDRRRSPALASCALPTRRGSLSNALAQT